MDDEFGSITIDNKNLLNDLLNLEGTNGNELFLDTYDNNNNNSNQENNSHNNANGNYDHEQNGLDNNAALYDQPQEPFQLYNEAKQQQQQQPYFQQRQPTQYSHHSHHSPIEQAQPQLHRHHTQQQQQQLHYAKQHHPIEQPALKHPDYDKIQANEAILLNGYMSGVSHQPQYSQKTSLQSNFQSATMARKTTLESPTFTKVEDDIYRSVSHIAFCL